MLGHRALGAVASLLIVAASWTSASAQVAPFFVPATLSAPAGGGFGAVPAALELDVLTVVPDDAVGLITAHHLRDTQKMIEGILHRLEIPFDDSNDYSEFNDFLDGLKGWDEKRTHAIAFFPKDGNDIEVVVFVPVTNYKDFARSLKADPDAVGPTEFEANPNGGGKGYIAQKSKYAVLSDRTESGKSMIETVLLSKTSLASANEPLRKWIGDHQLAGVVTSAGIQKAVDAMLEGLEEAKKDVPDEPIAAVLVRLLLPPLESLLKATREEMTHFAAAPSLSETKGLSFSARAVFKNDGKYAAAVRDVPTLPADALTHLPDESFFTAQAQVYPEKLSDSMMEFGIRVLEAVAKEGDLPVDLSVWKPIVEQARELGRGVKYVSAVQSLAGESVYDGMGGIYKVEDAAAFLKTNESVWKQSLDAVRKISDKIPEIPIEKTKLAGVEATRITVDMLGIMESLGVEGFNNPELKTMMETMIGHEGKMTFHIGAVDSTHVVYALGEATFTAIATNIRDGKPGLADDVMIKKTAALLPSGTAMVAYVDIGGYINMVKNMMIKMAAAQPQGNNPGLNPGMFAQLIPAFPQAPPLGYTVKVTPTTFEADFVVPMDLMEATRDYVKQAMAMFGGLR